MYGSSIVDKMAQQTRAYDLVREELFHKMDPVCGGAIPRMIEQVGMMNQEIRATVEEELLWR